MSRTMVSLFTDDTLKMQENQLKKMIKLSGNVAGYKVSKPKSIAFLLASQNNQLENIFEKMIPSQ